MKRQILCCVATTLALLSLMLIGVGASAKADKQAPQKGYEVLEAVALIDYMHVWGIAERPSVPVEVYKRYQAAMTLLDKADREGRREDFTTITPKALAVWRAAQEEAARIDAAPWIRGPGEALVHERLAPIELPAGFDVLRSDALQGTEPDNLLRRLLDDGDFLVRFNERKTFLSVKVRPTGPINVYAQSLSANELLSSLKSRLRSVAERAPSTGNPTWFHEERVRWVAEPTYDAKQGKAAWAYTTGMVTFLTFPSSEVTEAHLLGIGHEAIVTASYVGVTAENARRVLAGFEPFWSRVQFAAGQRLADKPEHRTAHAVALGSLVLGDKPGPPRGAKRFISGAMSRQSALMIQLFVVCLVFVCTLIYVVWTIQGIGYRTPRLPGGVGANSDAAIPWPSRVVVTRKQKKAAAEARRRARQESETESRDKEARTLTERVVAAAVHLRVKLRSALAYVLNGSAERHDVQSTLRRIGRTK